MSYKNSDTINTPPPNNPHNNHPCNCNNRQTEFDVCHYYNLNNCQLEVLNTFCIIDYKIHKPTKIQKSNHRTHKFPSESLDLILLYTQYTLKNSPELHSRSITRCKLHMIIDLWNSQIPVPQYLRSTILI